MPVLVLLNRVSVGLLHGEEKDDGRLYAVYCPSLAFVSLQQKERPLVALCCSFRCCHLLEKAAKAFHIPMPANYNYTVICVLAEARHQ
jgi:hypothetical protein